MNRMTDQTLFIFSEPGGVGLMTIHTGWDLAMRIVAGTTFLFSMQAWEFCKLPSWTSMAVSTGSVQKIMGWNNKWCMGYDVALDTIHMF